MSSVPHRKDIQGLRAIAVLAVMVFHLNPTWLPGGFVGVDAFLVISGFLITSILLHKKSSAGYSLTETLKYFYVSRFKRIVPAYFLMLIIVALVAAVLFLPSDFNTFRKGLEKAAWFTSNSYFASFGDYFAPANYEQPLLHTWSLAVEIQFYLLAPFLVLLLPVKWLKWVFTGLWFVLTGLAEYRLRFIGAEQATYYSLYARLPEFFSGGLAALYALNPTQRLGYCKWFSAVGLLLICIAAMVQPQLGPFPGITVLLPVVGSVLLLIQPASQNLVGKLLSSKILLWVGALSYSLYLWHWPVLALLRYYTGSEALNFEFTLLFIGLTLLLSVISYYGIESAFRGSYLAKKQLVAWSLLVLSVLGTSQSMVKVNAVLTPEQLPIEYRRYADPATICHGKLVGDCLKGDLNSNKEILVLGDSHAAMLNYFFDYLGKDLGFKARIITASSCVTIPGFDYQRLPDWAQPACQRQIQEASKYIDNAGLIIVAGMWSYQFEFDSFYDSLNEFIKSNHYVPIYFMPQIPLLDGNHHRGRRFASLGLQSVVSIDTDYIKANELLHRMIMPYTDINILDNQVSEKVWFSTVSNFYSDESHLNENGAVEYAKINLSVFQALIEEYYE
ncbi:acyltransferase [Vibrio mimicus]|uniref:acyltransferase family protein n=1 Tax=Vibrio mimicus TaxID=674 RepID=UPI0011D98D8E|nr:acyltransferase family protein [Vibrio mimicus]TXY30869.1 acyltransferase [Vibrio mimicus]BCN22653.1 putative monosaccharide biosynthesis protein [Vibrio mimicus]